MSKEVAVRDSANLAALDDFDSILRGGNMQEVVISPEEAQRQITERLLAAETNEELEQFGKATAWGDLLNVPMEIHGFKWIESSFADGPPVFVIVDAVRLDEGARVVLSTGGVNVMAQLSNLARREQFPCIRQLQASEKATKAGYYPLWLITPDEEKTRLAQDMASNPLLEEDDKE